MPSAPSAELTLILDRSWWSFDGPHGGFLASQLLQAMGQLTERPVRSLYVQFLAAPAEGPAVITAQLDREGRSTTAASADLMSAGAVAVRASAVLGPSAAGPSLLGPRPPDVEPPDVLPPLELPPDMAPFAQRLEFRLSRRTQPFSGGPAELVVWARFRDGRPLDAVSATVMVDATPPALYGTLRSPVAVPTVDLSVQYPGADATEGWVLLGIATRSCGQGWCVDDSDVWAADGTVLASARQTRLVLGGGV